MIMVGRGRRAAHEPSPWDALRGTLCVQVSQLRDSEVERVAQALLDLGVGSELAAQRTLLALGHARKSRR